MSTVKLRCLTKVLAVSLCISLLAAQEAKAITLIADTSGPLSSFEGGFGFETGPGIGPGINDEGTVVFKANLDTGGSGIFTGSGGLLTTIADTSGPFSSFGASPAINNEGTVVFNTILDAGGSGIFTSSGGALTTVAQISGTSTLVAPAINEQGKVAFFEFFQPMREPGSPGIIFTSSGGALTTIANTTGRDLLAIRGNQINNEGSVTFATIDRTLTGSGGSLNTIADTSGPLQTFYSSPPPISMMQALWPSELP